MINNWHKGQNPKINLITYIGVHEKYREKKDMGKKTENEKVMGK